MITACARFVFPSPLPVFLPVIRGFQAFSSCGKTATQSAEKREKPQGFTPAAVVAILHFTLSSGLRPELLRVQRCFCRWWL